MNKVNNRLDKDGKRITNLKELRKNCPEWSTDRHKDKNIKNSRIRRLNICWIRRKSRKKRESNNI